MIPNDKPQAPVSITACSCGASQRTAPNAIAVHKLDCAEYIAARRRKTAVPLSPEWLAGIREAALQAVKDHPSTTFMAPYESLADAVLAAVQPAFLAEVARLTARVAELEQQRLVQDKAMARLLDDLQMRIPLTDGRHAEQRHYLDADTDTAFPLPGIAHPKTTPLEATA